MTNLTEWINVATPMLCNLPQLQSMPTLSTQFRLKLTSMRGGVISTTRRELLAHLPEINNNNSPASRTRLTLAMTAQTAGPDTQL